MSKKAIFYISFFVVLTIVFYLLVKDSIITSSSKLAVINANIPAFNFTTQNNTPFTQDSVEGKVYVAEYFFTTCKGICPRMNTNMRRVYDKFKDNPNFLILSHTCMPGTDSLPLMKAYEQKMLKSRIEKKMDGSYKMPAMTAADSARPVPDNTNWKFLTGAKEDLYKMARQGYMIDNGKPDSIQLKDDFIHTQFFALVDRHRRLRGIYDGLKEDEIQTLMKDIDDLLKEKVSTKQFMGGFTNNPG